MTKAERIEAYLFALIDTVRMCENCKHYHPHYDAEGYDVSSGHCAHPRLKLRRAWDVCDKFEQK